MKPLKILADQWKYLLSMLPAGLDLEATLRQSGGLVRRRAIRTAETLLRLLLVYSLCGLSQRATAAWAQAQDVATLSGEALRKRLRNAAPWMALLLSAKLAERVERVEALPAARYHLRLVDATTATIPGSRGIDHRIHLGLDVGSFQIDRIDVTGQEKGESYARLELKPGDLVLADRGYCHRSGLATVRQAGADFLVRINWQNLPLEDCEHKRLDLVQLLEQVPGSEAVEYEVATVADKKKGTASMPVRLVVMKKPAEAAEAERQRIRREASRKGRKADPRTLKAAGYFFVVTSVPREALSADQVLELYRLRWQIEMAFKRLKGLLHLGEVPVKDPQLAHGYLCAKLLAALMVEDLTREFLAFSPSGPARPFAPGVPVANLPGPVGSHGVCLERSAECV
jgi:hypothetical protein